MEYNRIVAVTGLPGLYEIVSSKTDGALVRSLDDKTTKFISSRVHNLSHLESIEIYTVRDNVNLVEIFLAMQSNKTKLPDVKDNKALKGYFEKVYPDMDFERVYTSDMKKMVKWFEVLNNNNIEIKASAPAEEEENVAETLEAAGEKVVLDVKAEDTAETAKPKRAPRKKKAEDAEVEGAEKAEKAAPKKKAKSKE
ncbi:DUF5606 domain-containing protein [Flavisolibacter tropicus]|uniref:Uncharacterized protein n=1 Tax=Flavisolibacter tropicus TaxID=1492898 RepID=A0A172TX61_9BACT|nr:DUF5606 domain-containing protein [Flavisolibacter tropicus]ANE51679.1 hypothetical protein SY85_15395 [Flavisolibacter tropicus]